MAEIKIEKPRMNHFKEDVKIHPFKNRHKEIESVTLEFINLDKECEEDIKSGRGFFITNEIDFDEKTGNRTIDGLYSPLYGIDTFSDKVTDDNFYCECGKLRGSINEGEICPNCGTECKFVDADLSITGYIDLGKHYVINNGMYPLLAKLMGTRDLEEIITFSNKYDVNGKHIINADMEINGKKSKSKRSIYAGLGLEEFYERFDEIMEYYKNKNKAKTNVYDVIMRYRDCVFTSKIPVYSALLRPLVKENSRIGVIEINRYFSTILGDANTIREVVPFGIKKNMVTEGILLEIQQNYNEIYSYNIDALSSKKGIIRSSIICARVDSSGRAVIVPAIGHSVNEISLPYIAGCELLRPLIIRALVSMENISAREANSMIDKAMRKFSKKIWLLMNFLIKNSNNPPKVMVQRSPTLLQESLRFMDIKIIKADISDLTLDVPTAILDGMNADYDGDTFAMSVIFDNRLKEAWTPIHSPQFQFISRHTGEYSNFAKFIKDTAVILSELWEVGKDSTYYSQWASESEINKEIGKFE